MKYPIAGIFILATALPACSILVESPPGSDDTVGGDDGGGDDGPELPPPPAEFGVVLAPRTGDVIADHADAAAVIVRGLYTRPGIEVSIEAKVDGVWLPLATTTTASAVVPNADADEPRYGFEVTVDASAVWPRADLLHLRARAGANNVLIGFFADSDRCLATYPSWRDRAQHCGSVYLRNGIVLASTDAEGGFVEATLDETFLDDKGRISPDQTAAYYAAIDAPPTLDEFRARYVPTELAAARYYNAGDLGIGREMHCGTFAAGADTGVGCYVRNYGEFGGTRDFAESELVQGTNAFATVAMVYTPPIEAPNAVQFIVYGPTETLVNEAVLDTHGDNAAIPNNCINCHGSTDGYDATTQQLVNARFLPFDPDAFHFVDDGGLRRADQEEAMRLLNGLVARTEPAYATMEWVQGMYGGDVDVAGTVADTTWVASGWQGESAAQVYTHAVAPFCRACHAARDDAGGPEVWDFGDHDRFLGAAATIDAVVCDGGDGVVHRMPSAEATQLAFWRGPARAYLGAMLDLGPCAP